MPEPQMEVRAAAPFGGWRRTLPLELTGSREVTALVQTRFGEYYADISPDGRWIAYQYLESDPSQIIVRPFPNVQEGRWQVSTAGGRHPVWSRNGRELFFLDLEDV
jgi:hypothetical protein